jgi:hypothetical protein
MKVSRFAGILSLSLMAAACGGGDTEDSVVNDTVPPPAAAPDTMSHDTMGGMIDSTATSTTTLN